MPKLYLTDTGLACSLLGIRSPEELATHYIRGAIFENFVLTELRKMAFHHGQDPRMFFWRDRLGREVDCIIERGAELLPVEIKWGSTMQPSFFDQLRAWNTLAGRPEESGAVIYGGDERWNTKHGDAVSWRDLPAWAAREGIPAE